MSSKIYVLDTNLPTIYGENINLDKISRVFRELSNDNLVVITTNGWHEQAVQVCNLLNATKIDIISGGGSCLKEHDNPNYVYAGFIDKTDVDLILHLAIASYSGVFVKGRKNGNDSANVLLNYFLNYQDAKEFKSIWKFNFQINNDYVTFEQELDKIDVSEIYVYGNNQNFQSKFFEDYNSFNSLIKERNISGKCFFKDTYLFTGKKVSKQDLVIKYAEQKALNINDVIYISLGEISNEGLDNYNQIILPSSIEISANNPVVSTYNVANPDDITKLLEETANIKQN